MYSIEVKGVSKKYRIYHDKSLTLKERILFFNRTKYTEHQVLDNIDIFIEKGSTVGLIGQNGSGKSTLLKLLTGIIYPDKGDIRINGKVSSLLELGAGFHSDFSGRENIYTNASIFGLTKKEIDKRFNQIVEFSELQEFIDNPVRTYSSGMYMRLAFSIAINVDADILLIDEILAVGDAGFQKKCMDKILEFKYLGKTVVIVSHDHNSVKRLCNSAIWLNQGGIAAIGEAEYICDRYVEYMHKSRAATVIHEDLATVNDSDNMRIDNSNLNNGYFNEEDKTNKITPARWGTKEMEFLKIGILNKDENEEKSFKYGDKLIIRMNFKVNTDINDPVFGFGIFLLEGTRCYGTNSSIDNIRIKKLCTGEKGVIDFVIENLYLVNGIYCINLAIHAQDGYTYDYLNRMYSINIYSSELDIGIFKPRHDWIVKVDN